MGTKVVASAMARQHSVTLTFSAVGKLLQSQRCQNVKIAEPTKQLTWAANRRMLAEYPRWTCSPKHRQNKDGRGRREGQEGRVCFKSLITPPADNIQALGVATPLLQERNAFGLKKHKRLPLHYSLERAEKSLMGWSRNRGEERKAFGESWADVGSCGSFASAIWGKAQTRVCMQNTWGYLKIESLIHWVWVGDSALWTSFQVLLMLFLLCGPNLEQPSSNLLFWARPDWVTVAFALYQGLLLIADSPS